MEELPCNKTCPKCGHSDINMVYRYKGERFYNQSNVDDANYYKEVGMNNVEVIKEHLSCGCRKCQYNFIIDVKEI